ncbi:MAG: hypothetical protein CVU77_01770 [Elusimicrobia bacterium HGW-Elusimicrobia-1]|jgi:nucleoside-diphosphate-sugar epimerase|nr:MAG: hypothetical protein CVU77_01770 [Elusimicrobia bacterium HGW-Elusimicrobia-1]
MTEITESFKNKTILITGGRGYLADTLVALLRGTDCKVIRADIKPPEAATPRAGESPEIEEIVEDIGVSGISPELLRRADIIFHFAAQTSVYRAEEDPADDWRINVMPMLSMLETCRKNRHCPTVLFSGTVTVTGMSQYLPVDEKHPDAPMTIYDIHKLTAENYLKHYAASGFVKGCVLRLANVYGPGKKSSSADRGILNLMARKALAGEDITLYGDGNFTRDYIYVNDVARAFLTAASKIDLLNGRHFVLGSGTGHTVSEAFSMVAEMAMAKKPGIKSTVKSVPAPKNLSPIENRNFVADRSEFTKLTGWAPEYDLKTGIKSTIDSIYPRN